LVVQLPHPSTDRTTSVRLWPVETNGRRGADHGSSHDARQFTDDRTEQRLAILDHWKNARAQVAVAVFAGIYITKDPRPAALELTR
jgi:hypothetical protein